MPIVKRKVRLGGEPSQGHQVQEKSNLLKEVVAREVLNTECRTHDDQLQR